MLAGDERRVLMTLHKENKQLRMEKEILKKGQYLLRKKNEVKFNFIKKSEGSFLVKKQCEVMNVSRSGYYSWRNRPTKIISELELNLYRRTKMLFKESRQSLGSRQLMMVDPQFNLTQANQIWAGDVTTFVQGKAECT